MPFKQTKPAMVLQILDHPAERRLGKTNLLGRATKASQFSNLEKRAKLTRDETHDEIIWVGSPFASDGTAGARPWGKAEI